MSRRKFLLPLLLLLTALSPCRAEIPADGPKAELAGSWHIDLARSTELSPWKDYELTIGIEGDIVTLHRRLAWGRREFTDTIAIDLHRIDNVFPVEMWPENRHLGAYIGGDRTKHVHAAWLDHGRILRLTTDLVLQTQQGPRDVNILSDYKVSPNGDQLTLTELRSTRNRPIVYLFKRVQSAAK